MALEKGLVDGHVLDGNQTLARLALDDPIDQQERVAVRQQALYFLNIHGVQRISKQCIRFVGDRS
jgi:hypothetical protein